MAILLQNTFSGVLRFRDLDAKNEKKNLNKFFDYKIIYMAMGRNIWHPHDFRIICIPEADANVLQEHPQASGLINSRQPLFVRRTTERII